MRWLAGKAHTALTNWSIVSENDVLDHVYAAFVAIAADGHALLDPASYDHATLGEVLDDIEIHAIATGSNRF